MSNDTKLWIVRFVFFCCFAIAGAILLQVVSSGFAGGFTGSTALKIIVFFAICVLGLVAAVVYYRYKNERWDPTDFEGKADKVALETLSKLAEQQSSNRKVRSK